MSAIIFGNFFHELFHVLFVDLYEFLALPAKIVYVTGVYVEPQSVYVQVESLQTLSEKTVASDILQLLKSIDLHTEIQNYIIITLGDN